ncbi:protein of unknown function (plasmid) [Caballeronia sp. S22]
MLAVPSAVVPAETNYLLNLLHPDFARTALGRAMNGKPTRGGCGAPLGTTHDTVSRAPVGRRRAPSSP